MRKEMMAIFHVVDTPDGPDLQVGEEDDPSAVRITFHVPVSRVIDGTPELRELVSTLTRERDEARAEVEMLRATRELDEALAEAERLLAVQVLYEALVECVDRIDTFYGPPGSNRIDRELIARARAALAKARDGFELEVRDE